VLVIDDAVPDPAMGAGFPRAAALVHTLAELGYLITIYATGENHRMLQPNRSFPAVEVVSGDPAGLGAFLTSRRHYHLVIVSRPHNMQYLKAAVGSGLSTLGAPCVYDAEAVYAFREIGRRRISGDSMSESDRHALIDEELKLTRGCAAVLAVSEVERQVFAAAGIRNVVVVGHAVDPQSSPTPFERRQTILFVGAFTADSPNEDAVLFFCGEVLPILRTSGTCQAPMVIAGARIPEHVKAVAEPGVRCHSDVDDLTPFYDAARVFVAPMRYSAGIPLKVLEAAARGVPIVCTPLVAQQLGWEPGTELLTAESAADFARAIESLYGDRDLWLRLREAALKRVARDYSPAVFRSALHHALNIFGAAGG
jgi:glycosyltransferase involved in cell wall biosynthesis